MDGGDAIETEVEVSDRRRNRSEGEHDTWLRLSTRHRAGRFVLIGCAVVLCTLFAVAGVAAGVGVNDAGEDPRAVSAAGDDDRVEWEFDGEGYDIDSDVAVDDGIVYVASRKSVFANDPGESRSEWERDDLDATGGIVVEGGTVYVGTTNGSVVALDAETGEDVWTASADGEIRTTPTVHGVDGGDALVVVGDEAGTVAAFDAADGDRAWTHEAGDRIRSSPAATGGDVYVGSDDGTVYALSATDGSEEWTRDLGDPVRSSPTVADGVVYVGGDEGTIFALDEGDGSDVWTHDADDAVRSAPTVADGEVYAGTENGTAYALEASTGTERWTFRADGAVRAPVKPVGEDVFVASYGGYIYEVNASDGSSLLPPVREYDDRFRSLAVGDDGDVFAGGYDTFYYRVMDSGHSPNSPHWRAITAPSLAEGTVYVGNRDHHLYALDERTGEVEWRQRTGDLLRSAPQVADGVVYVGSDDGSVYAFDADDGPVQWTYETEGEIRASPTVAQGTVFVRSDDDRLHAINATRGERIWSESVVGGYWDPPVVADGTVYLTDGGVRALDATDGSTRWSYFSEETIFVGSPTIADDTVYAGGDDGTVHAIDASTGESSWHEELPAQVHRSPTVADDTVYVGLDATYDEYDGDVLFALSTDDGSVRWSGAPGLDVVTATPTVAGGEVYAGDDGIYAYDVADGTERWNETGAGWVHSGPTVAGGTLYVDTASGVAAIDTGHEATSEDSRIALGTEGSIEGVRYDDHVAVDVTETDGEVVANATVTVEAVDGDGGQEALRAERLTDERGEAYVSGLETGSYRVVAAYETPSGERFVNETLVTYEAGTTETVDLVLPFAFDQPSAAVAVAPACLAPGATVTLDGGASTAAGAIADYQWSIDGESASGEAVEWTFDQPGEYPVELTVTTDDGFVDSTERTVTVSDELAVRSAVDTVQAGEAVTFDACGGGDGADGVEAAYEWTFPDGSGATGSTIARSFDEPGTYEVTVTDGDDEASTTVDVDPAPIRIADPGASVEGAGIRGIGPVTEIRPEIETESAVSYVVFDLEGDRRTVEDGPWHTEYDLGEFDEPSVLTVIAVDEEGNRATETIRLSAWELPDWLEWYAAGDVDVRTEPAPRIDFDRGLIDAAVDIDEVPDWFPLDVEGEVDVGLEASGNATYYVDEGVLDVATHGGGTLLVAGRGGELDVRGTGSVVDEARADGADHQFVLEGGEYAIDGRLHAGPGPNGRFGVTNVGEITVDSSVGPSIHSRASYEYDDGSLVVRDGTVWPGAFVDVRFSTAVGFTGVHVVGEGSIEGSLGVEHESPYLTDPGVRTELEASATVDALFWTLEEDLGTFEYEAGSVEPSPSASETTATGSAGWTQRSPTGDRPGHGAAATAHAADDSLQLVRDETASTGPERVTDLDSVDEAPAMEQLGTDHLLVWSAPDEDGHDDTGAELVAKTLTDGEWSERTTVTDVDNRTHHDPALATRGEEAVAVWTVVDDDLASLAGPAEAAEHVQVAFARFDGEEWHDPELLTDTDGIDATPTVAEAGDDGWLVAWERSSELNRSAATLDVGYAVIDDDGPRATDVIENASEPVVAPVDDESADVGLAYRDRSAVGDGSEVLAYEVLSTDDQDDLARERVATHEVDALYDFTIGGGSIAWVDAAFDEPKLRYADVPGAESDALGAASDTSGAEPDVLALDEGIAAVEDLDLVAIDDEETLLTYRARTDADGSRDVVYRVERDGEWIYDRSVAASPDGELAIRSPTTAPDEDGFHTAFAASAWDEGSVPDLFALHHEFQPDYAVTVTEAPDDAVPGDNVTVAYRLENLGDRPGADEVPVEIRSGDVDLEEKSHDPLEPGDGVDREFTVEADETGTLTVVADPAGDLEQLSTANAAADVAIATTDLSIVDYEERRGEEGYEVRATVANDGGATATDVGVVIGQGGDELTDASLGDLPPGEEANATLAIDPDAIDRSVQADLSATATGPDGRSVTDDRPVRLLRPDVTVRGVTDYVATDDGVRATVLLENAGFGPANGAVSIESPDGSESLGTGSLSLAAGSPDRPSSEGVAVDLSSVEPGEELIVVAEPDVPDATPGSTAAHDRVGPVIGTTVDEEDDRDGDGGDGGGGGAPPALPAPGDGGSSDPGSATISFVDPPDELVAGDTVRFDVRIETGDAEPAPESVTLALDLGDRADAATETVQLAGAETEATIDVEAAPGDVGEGVPLRLRIDDAEDQVTVDVREPEPPVEVRSIDVDEAAIGGSLDVAAAVVGASETSRTHDLELVFEDEVVATESVTLEPGDELTVDLAGAVPDSAEPGPATVSVRVAGEVGEDAVREETIELADGSEGLPGFGVAAAVVALLLLLAAARRAVGR